MNSATSAIEITVHQSLESIDQLRLPQDELVAPAQDLRWLRVLREGFRHRPYCLEAKHSTETCGLLPLVLVDSYLFGRYLVGLPYVNTGGVIARDDSVATALISRAVALADELRVKHLELRHEAERKHASLADSLTTKVHMRMALEPTVDAQWSAFKAKVRNQVRKGENGRFDVSWGGGRCVDDFYSVFSHKMRDLGTPVFSKRLFRSIVRHFQDDAEICVLGHAGRPVAAALLIHGDDTTEVPSAAALGEFNKMNANMAMYWALIQRAICRGNRVFDFGRSTLGSNTFRFKKQWGAQPHPSVWQYYCREGDFSELRRENGKYDRRVRLWKQLPVWLTRLVGPPIVRGIP